MGIYVNLGTKLNVQDACRLEHDMEQMMDDLDIKHKQKVVVQAPTNSHEIKFGASYNPRRNKIMIENNDIMTFNLATGMYMAHLSENGEDLLLSPQGILLQSYGYAVAYCKRKSEQEGVGYLTYIPYGFSDARLPGHIFKDIGDNGLPRLIWENAKYIIERYGMELVGVD